MLRVLKLLLKQKRSYAKLQQDTSYAIGAYRDGTPEVREQIEQVMLDFGKQRGDDWGKHQVERLRKLKP
ncbi:MAG TPA: hypothetical protein V6C95_07310 [Coleofasciculaceae cyanobacterium]